MFWHDGGQNSEVRFKDFVNETLPNDGFSQGLNCEWMSLNVDIEITNVIADGVVIHASKWNEYGIIDLDDNYNDDTNDEAKNKHDSSLNESDDSMFIKKSCII